MLLEARLTKSRMQNAEIPNGSAMFVSLVER